MENIPAFTEQEKRYVLAELIKNSNIPVEDIMSILRDVSFDRSNPIWNYVLLPNGRNLHSCINTVESLRQSLSISQPPPPRMYNPVPIVPPKVPKRKPENLETPASSKRRLSDMSSQHASIAPKPPSNNGSPTFGLSQSTKQPKKRGRPSKADVEKRQAEAIERGEVIAPPKTLTPRPDPQQSREAFSAISSYPAIAPATMPSPLPARSPMTPGPFEKFDNPEIESSSARQKRPKPLPRPQKSSNPGEGSFSLIRPQPVPSEKSEPPTVMSVTKSIVPNIEPGPVAALPPVQPLEPVQVMSQAPSAVTQAPPTS